MEISKEQLAQLIQAQFSELTPELQSFIVSDDFKKTLKGIAVSHELEEYEDLISNEVVLALIGIVPFTELPNRITTVVGTSNEIAVDLVEDIVAFAVPDYLGLVPTELSPTAQELTEEFIPEEPKESPILQATRTMQGDVAEAKETSDVPQWRTMDDSDEDTGPKETSGVENPTDSTDVPQYAKPLTDTPKYE